jgi:hypothetical protein
MYLSSSSLTTLLMVSVFYNSALFFFFCWCFDLSVVSLHGAWIFSALSYNCLCIVTGISSVRQWLAKHVPEGYAVNSDRRLLLNNGFDYQGTKHVSGTTHT